MKRLPNIVLFMADQLIPMMTGAYGHPCAHTPNIDRLAREGVTFDSAYSTIPVCVPARCSVLSGMYGASTGCFDNGGILPAGWPTHNHYLNIAGYDTAISGKAHFIGPDQLHGFKERFMTDIYPSGFRFMPQRGAGMKPENLHPNPIAVDYLSENVGVRQSSMQLGYDEEAMFHARMYLARKRSAMSGSGQEALPARDDTPFFLQVSLNHPHEPFHVLQKHWDLYEGAEIPVPEIPDDIDEHHSSMDRSLIKLHGSDRVNVTAKDNLKDLHRAYLASVSFVDEKVGELCSMLDEFGLADNTIILFVSDHGDMLGARGMVQKRVFYENSARVAMILYAPPSFSAGEPGTRVSEPVSLTDVAPTILELAGISDAQPMDGGSLLSLARGNREPDRYVFCENCSEGVDQVCLMIRKGNFKYTYLHRSGERQLFDLRPDPGEWNNLADDPEFADICKEMEGLILEKFSLDDLEVRAQRSFEQKSLVQRSMLASGGVRWNYEPKQDVHNMYWRDR